MGAFGISSTVDYLEQANDSLVTIVQIETKEALENVSFCPALLPTWKFLAFQNYGVDRMYACVF